MTPIEVTPQLVEETARTVRNHGTRIQDALDAVDAEIRSTSPDVFAGHRADNLRTRYASTRNRLMEFMPLLHEFAQKLDQAAVDFRTADETSGEAF